VTNPATGRTQPFVGPAGAVLADALVQAGIERSDVFMTKAVKHFKYRARGKRRIHQRPSAAEQAACRPWLERELLVKPVVVVAFGATAAHTLIGRATPIGKSRGRLLEGALFWPVLVTAHPPACCASASMKPAARHYAPRRKAQG
jgi:uracil-DNA glycosylase